MSGNGTPTTVEDLSAWMTRFASEATPRQKAATMLRMLALGVGEEDGLPLEDIPGEAEKIVVVATS